MTGSLVRCYVLTCRMSDVSSCVLDVTGAIELLTWCHSDCDVCVVDVW